MHILRRFLGVLAGVLVAVLATGGAAVLAADLATGAAADFPREISANFEQVISAKSGPLRYTGSVKIAGGEYFWHYQTPENKRICARAGAGAAVIDDDLEQVQSFSGQVLDLSALELAPCPAERAVAAGAGARCKMAEFEGLQYFIYARASQIFRIDYTDEFGSAVRVVFTPAAVAPDCRVPAHYDFFEGLQ